MNIANKISTFRILSVPFFIACIMYYSPQKDILRFLALGVFLLAVVSDALDGYIARRAKNRSRAGLILDPLADKLLLVSAFICLNLTRNFPQGVYFPAWVVLIVISRDALILLGALVIYIVRQKIDIRPSQWGKITTTFQMLAVLGVLLQWRISFFIWWLAVIFTIISGVDYLQRGFKILYASDNHRNTA